MLTLETINALRVLLARTSLKGDEVDTFVKVIAALDREEHNIKQAMTGGAVTPSAS